MRVLLEFILMMVQAAPAPHDFGLLRVVSSSPLWLMLAFAHVVAEVLLLGRLHRL